MHCQHCALLSRHQEVISSHYAAALPLQEDFQEAAPVYGALCGLMTSPETAPKVANLMPQLVQVLVLLCVLCL